MNWNRTVSIAARIFTMFSIVMGCAVLTINLFPLKNPSWKCGGLKGGDLFQHYGAADMWADGKIEGIYKDYRLGNRLNELGNQISGESRPGNMRKFNYVYSPLIAWALAPLRPIPYPVWAVWWLAIILLAHLASFIVFAWAHRSLNLLRILPTLAFLGFPGFFWVVTFGQTTTVSMLILAFTALLLNRRACFWAGMVFSCAFFKPQLMPFVALCMAIAGYWKFSAGVVLGTALWFLAGVQIAGAHANLLWLQSIAGMTAGEQFQVPGLSQSWPALIQFAGADYLPGHWLSAAGWMLGLCATCAMGLLLRAGQFETQWRRSYALFISIACWLCVSPYVPCYELLLGVPWWIAFASTASDNPARQGLIALFWLLPAVALTGLFLGFSISAPFMTLWLCGSLFCLIDWGLMRAELRMKGWDLFLETPQVRSD
jgi:hypothetical protein